ncbi:NUDIX hydrolase [Pseudonocardia saturnea]
MTVPIARLEEFDHDPLAPHANAVVRDDDGRVLLVRRTDTGDWELPGGRVDVGESAVDAVVREVAEESGLVIDVLGIAGLYSDPTHVVRQSGTGEIRQPFAVCFHAAARAGAPRPDHRETSDARWWAVPDVDTLSVQPAVRRRLRDALTAQVHLD